VAWLIGYQVLSMADEKLVALLRRGVAEWNARRKQFLGRIDLAEANLSVAFLSGANLNGADLRKTDLRGAILGGETQLSGANLVGANLSGAYLSGADLSGADLSGAYLSGADLSGAGLMGAKLSRADLRRAGLGGAKLRWADLSGADLSGADLIGANLVGAGLGEANFREVMLSETVFVDVDLSAVTGLETCRHLGPSTIDFRTLQRSGPLPLAFLRGVGLPDNLIDYLPSLLNQAIQMYSCFISYSSKDQDFAERLHADLQNKGVRCWFAPHDLPWGAKTWDAIDEAIRLRDKLLLILSECSIASDWVEDEVNKAFAEERDRKQLVLFPVRIDDAIMQTSEPWALKLRDQRNIGDFRAWKDHDAYQKSLDRLLRDLTVSAAKP
jgi:TIR domain/Pentapeptide repeats (8 copies)